MIAFDISYEATAGKTWEIHLPGDAVRSFPTRLQALAYAIREAGRRKADDVVVQISVEGADGRWRAFDPDMKAPNLPIAPLSERSALR